MNDRLRFSVTVAAVLVALAAGIVLMAVLSGDGGEEAIPVPGSEAGRDAGERDEAAWPEGAGTPGEAQGGSQVDRPDAGSGGDGTDPGETDGAGSSSPGSAPDGEEVGPGGHAGGDDAAPLLTGRVMSHEGKALAGAQIALTRPTSVPVGPDLNLMDMFKKLAAAEAILLETQCDGEGRFALLPGAVEAGTYALRASSPGRTTELVHGVSLVAGGTRDVGDIVLKKPATIEGSVRTQGGEPVEGAIVVAIREPREEAFMKGRIDFGKYWTRSGPSGSFAFHDLPPGEGYVFIAKKEGLSTAVRPRIDVPAEGPVDLVLSKGFTLEGRVVDDATGRGIAGARIGLVNHAERGGFGQGETDGEGRFRIEHLAPGGYFVMITAPGYRQEETEIEGPPGGVLHEEYRLAPGLRLSGKVVEAGTGKPIPGAEITASSQGGEFGPMGGATRCVSGPDGTFVLDGVNVGKEIHMDRASGTRTEVSMVVVMARKKGWSHGEPLQLEIDPRAETKEGVVIEMERRARAAGRVLDADGEPVPGAKVTVISETWFRDRFLTGETAEPISTDAEGAFAVGLPPGERGLVLAHHPEHAFDFEPFKDPPPGEMRKDLVLRLEEGGSVRGRVLDETGAPLLGEEVRAVFQGRLEGVDLPPRVFAGLPWFVKKTFPDREGAFVFHHLKAGPWAFTVGEARRGPASPGDVPVVRKTVQVSEGRAEEVVLQRQPPLTIEGLVTDGAGRPLAGAEVRGFCEATRTWAHVQTGPGGTFRLEGLGPGSYVLSVWKRGYQGQDRPEVEAGATGVKLVMKKIETPEEK